MYIIRKPIDSSLHWESKNKYWSWVTLKNQNYYTISNIKYCEQKYVYLWVIIYLLKKCFEKV